MSDCRYYLARDDGKMPTAIDGCHESPAEVAKAAKLMLRIFGDSGPWLMLEVHSMPDSDPPINEEAVERIGGISGADEALRKREVS